jgi:hypothetical protein
VGLQHLVHEVHVAEVVGGPGVVLHLESIQRISLCTHIGHKWAVRFECQSTICRM